MTRYIVERTFSDDHGLPGAEQDPQACLDIVENNTLDGVTWLYSFVTPEGRKSFCIYDAPTPEAIRRAARRNGLPIDRIIEVSVLNPYFYLAYPR